MCVCTLTRNVPCINNYNFCHNCVFTACASNLLQPLYDGSPLSLEESMYCTYLYAVRNKLSYWATAQLLELVRIHGPAPNSYPRSFYTVKKHLANMDTLNIHQFCSGCLDEIPRRQRCCSKRSCKHHELCYFAVLPFEDHLKEMFSGNNIILCTTE